MVLYGRYIRLANLKNYNSHKVQRLDNNHYGQGYHTRPLTCTCYHTD